MDMQTTPTEDKTSPSIKLSTNKNRYTISSSAIFETSQHLL